MIQILFLSVFLLLSSAPLASCAVLAPLFSSGSLAMGANSIGFTYLVSQATAGEQVTACSLTGARQDGSVFLYTSKGGLQSGQAVPIAVSSLSPSSSYTFTIVCGTSPSLVVSAATTPYLYTPSALNATLQYSESLAQPAFINATTMEFSVPPLSLISSAAASWKAANGNNTLPGIAGARFELTAQNWGEPTYSTLPQKITIYRTMAFDSSTRLQVSGFVVGQSYLVAVYVLLNTTDEVAWPGGGWLAATQSRPSAPAFVSSARKSITDFSIVFRASSSVGYSPTPVSLTYCVAFAVFPSQGDSSPVSPVVFTSPALGQQLAANWSALTNSSTYYVWLTCYNRLGASPENKTICSGGLATASGCIAPSFPLPQLAPSFTQSSFFSAPTQTSVSYSFYLGYSYPTYLSSWYCYTWAMAAGAPQPAIPTGLTPDAGSLSSQSLAFSRSGSLGDLGLGCNTTGAFNFIEAGVYDLYQSCGDRTGWGATVILARGLATLPASPPSAPTIASVRVTAISVAVSVQPSALTNGALLSNCSVSLFQGSHLLQSQWFNSSIAPLTSSSTLSVSFTGLSASSAYNVSATCANRAGSSTTRRTANTRPPLIGAAGSVAFSVSSVNDLSVSFVAPSADAQALLQGYNRIVLTSCRISLFSGGSFANISNFNPSRVDINSVYINADFTSPAFASPLSYAFAGLAYGVYFAGVTCAAQNGSAADSDQSPYTQPILVYHNFQPSMPVVSNVSATASSLTIAFFASKYSWMTPSALTACSIQYFTPLNSSIPYSSLPMQYFTAPATGALLTRTLALAGLPIAGWQIAAAVHCFNGYRASPPLYIASDSLSLSALNSFPSPMTYNPLSYSAPSGSLALSGAYASSYTLPSALYLYTASCRAYLFDRNSLLSPQNVSTILAGPSVLVNQGSYFSLQYSLPQLYLGQPLSSPALSGLTNIGYDIYFACRSSLSGDPGSLISGPVSIGLPPPSAPAMVASLSVKPLGQGALVNFSCPTSNGASISGCRMRLDDGGADLFAGVVYDQNYRPISNQAQCASEGAIVVIQPFGLKDFTTYTFSVSCSNSIGAGPLASFALTTPAHLLAPPAFAGASTALAKSGAGTLITVNYTASQSLNASASPPALSSCAALAFAAGKSPLTAPWLARSNTIGTINYGELLTGVTVGPLNFSSAPNGIDLYFWCAIDLLAQQSNFSLPSLTIALIKPPISSSLSASASAFASASASASYSASGVASTTASATAIATLTATASAGTMTPSTSASANTPTGATSSINSATGSLLSTLSTGSARASISGPLSPSLSFTASGPPAIAPSSSTSVLSISSIATVGATATASVGASSSLFSSTGSTAPRITATASSTTAAAAASMTAASAAPSSASVSGPAASSTAAAASYISSLSSSPRSSTPSLSALASLTAAATGGLASSTTSGPAATANIYSFSVSSSSTPVSSAPVISSIPVSFTLLNYSVTSSSSIDALLFMVASNIGRMLNISSSQVIVLAVGSPFDYVASTQSANAPLVSAPASGLYNVSISFACVPSLTPQDSRSAQQLADLFASYFLASSPTVPASPGLAAFVGSIIRSSLVVSSSPVVLCSTNGSYSACPADQPSSGFSLALWLIIVIAVGGVLFAALVFVAVRRSCYPRSRPHQPVSSLSKSASSPSSRDADLEFHSLAIARGGEGETNEETTGDPHSLPLTRNPALLLS